MSLAIEKEAEVTFDFDYETLAKDVISFTMEHEHFPFEAEISLTLTDNEGIWKVNKEFREIDRPTDVLSFPMLEYDVPGDFSQIENQTEDCFNPDTGEILLGGYYYFCGQGQGTGRGIWSQHAKRICISDCT